MAFSLEEVKRKVSQGEPLSPSERSVLVSLGDYSREQGASAPESASSKGSNASAPASSAPESTEGLSPGVSNTLGNVAGTMANMTGAVSGVPGAAGAIGGLVEDFASGASPADTIGRAATSIGRGVIGREMMKAGMPSAGVGLGINTALGLASEYGKENPNYAGAFAKNAPAAIGSFIGSPLGPLGSLVGSLVGGYFGKQSFDEGYLGDAFDTRSFEEMRDVAEGMGYSVEDTASMAGIDRGLEGMGIDPEGFSFGLTNATKDDPYSPQNAFPDLIGDFSGEGFGEVGGVSGTASEEDQESAASDTQGDSEAEGLS